MRYLPLLLLLVPACHGDLGAPSGGLDYAPALVVDSVTHQLLGGVAVMIGPSVSVTTAGGAFMFPVAAGPDTVRIAAAGYEAYTRVIPAGLVVQIGDTLRFPLRRIGIFAARCRVSADGFRADIVDLQGGLSQQQMAQSSVSVADSTSPITTIYGTTWQLMPVTDQMWYVTIPSAPPKTIFAYWALQDPAGPSRTGWCQPDGFDPR